MHDGAAGLLTVCLFPLIPLMQKLLLDRLTYLLQPSPAENRSACPATAGVGGKS